MIVYELFSISLLILHKILCGLLYKIARIPMVIVKPPKLYTFYDIFMALYYVFLSMSIFIFKVCWEIPCSEDFDLAETIQMILGASQVSGFCMVWVFTVKNI